MFAFAGFLMGVFLWVAPVQAVPILGASVFVATTGDVIATKLPASAGFSSNLFLDTPGNTLGIIFNNHTTPDGTTMNLGSFTAGTELVFRIFVINTGRSFFTGPASRNPDNVFHAVVDTAFAPGETLVGFEDLFGGGDQDYDDNRFSFTNVGTVVPPIPPVSSVPEPGSLLLLSSGVVGLLGFGRKVKS